MTRRMRQRREFFIVSRACVRAYARALHFNVNVHADIRQKGCVVATQFGDFKDGFYAKLHYRSLLTGAD